MSNRIIAAESLSEFRPFPLDALSGSSQTSRLPMGGVRQPGTPEEIRQAAFEAGRSAGIEEGLRQADEQQRVVDTKLGRTMLERVDAIWRGFDDSLTEIDARLAQSILQLSVQMAEQVVRTHVQLNPDAVMAPLQEALRDLLADAQRVTIRVAQSDEAIVLTGLAELIADRQCEVRVDPALSAGSCRLDSAVATIDARLETRWQHLLASLGQTVPDQDPEHD